MNLLQCLRAGLACLMMVAVYGCGGGGGSNGGGTGSGGTGSGGTGAASQGNGTLRMAITDAPACGYDAVNITVEKVRVHRSSSASDDGAGWSEIVLSPAQRVNLLSLTNGVLFELGQIPLPAGKYTQLRLVLASNGGSTPLANSVIPTGRAETPLKTPSGQQSGLKANINIDVLPGKLADFVIDFDACKSIVKAGNSGQYLLKPVLTVVPRFVSGVSGFVNASLVLGTTVSLQQNGVVIKATVPDASGAFLLQPVLPGNYTLVMAAPGRTTLVVGNVVINDGSVTPLNLAGTALNPPLSPTGTLLGTVAMTAPIDASVRALQTLGNGASIELDGQAVDSVSGAYAYSLPVNAPLVAPYAPGPGSLVFAPDATAAGKYRLEASDGVAIKTATPPTLTPGAVVTTNFAFP